MKLKKKMWALLLAVCLMVPQTVFATVENPDLDDSIQPLTTEYVEIELQNQKDSYGYGDTIDFHVTASD